MESDDDDSAIDSIQEAFDILDSSRVQGESILFLQKLICNLLKRSILPLSSRNVEERDINAALIESLKSLRPLGERFFVSVDVDRKVSVLVN